MNERKNSFVGTSDCIQRRSPLYLDEWITYFKNSETIKKYGLIFVKHHTTIPGDIIGCMTCRKDCILILNLISVSSDISASVLQSIESVLKCTVEILDSKFQSPIKSERIQCKLIIPYGTPVPKKQYPLISMASPIDIFLFALAILLLSVCLIALVIHWWQYEQPWMGLAERIIRSLKYPFMHFPK